MSAASSISRLAAAMMRPSAVTRSPASKATTSPGTSSSAGSSTSSPSRRTRALTTIIFWSAATAAAALPSWLRPRYAFRSVSRISSTPVDTCPTGQMLRMPATRRTICIGSAYWRRNARRRGSGCCSANRLAPNFVRRAVTSAAARPWSGVHTLLAQDFLGAHRVPGRRPHQCDLAVRGHLAIPPAPWPPLPSRRAPLRDHDTTNGPHRLLKNHAREVIGPRPYALVTDAAAEALGIPTDGMVAAEEAYDDTPPIPVHILALA